MRVFERVTTQQALYTHPSTTHARIKQQNKKILTARVLWLVVQVEVHRRISDGFPEEKGSGDLQHFRGMMNWHSLDILVLHFGQCYFGDLLKRLVHVNS